MSEQKLSNSQAVKSSSRDRDTDADGLPDRIDSQYSYPPAEQVKRTREMHRTHQVNVPRQKHRR